MAIHNDGGRPMDVESRDGRARMVAAQLVARGIHDERVLTAMLEVSREAFIPGEPRRHAYEDAPQSIGCGQTISQPFIVAYMLELLHIAPTDRVLEVGTGTGYQAALLARLATSVVTIERHAQLAEAAKKNLAKVGITNCEVRVGDGTTGAPDRAPFDVIVVAASGPRIPPSLRAQLAPGGRLVCPVGEERAAQRLVRVTRGRDGAADVVEDLDPVVFVPLIGQEGWTE
jgi:protein-L-isoaspartate(D-aspartate) O-methyltransferase